MGSLSNLYISQSYQSLIHIATNNTASATLIDLQDGLGNSIGVAVNTSGDLYLSGSLTASLQQGYLYVGGASGKTYAFPTSSLVTNINTGSLVTTASFNAYTASNDSKVNQLINATSSYAISSSVAAVDAAQQSQINNLIAATGSYLTSSVPLTSLNAFTASQETKNTTLEGVTSSLQAFTQSQENLNSTFATTGSNVFVGNQVISGNISAISASFLYVQTTYETASVIYSSGSNQFGDELTDIQTLSGSVKVQGSLTVNGTNVLTSSIPLDSLNAFTSSQNTKNTTLENVTASLQAFTASQWVLNGTFATTSSFNAYTQSNDQRVSSLEVNSASVNTSITNINSATASLFTSASLGLVTASFSENTLTFTKGDTSTFGVVIPDVSGSTIPAGTISGSSQITALGFVSSSITASSLVTASVSLNTITFTKGDASTFNIIVNTGSAITTDITSLNAFTQSQETKDTTLANVTSSLNSATASLFTSASLALVTASFDNGTRNLTFTKGDTQTFSVNIPDVSGSAGNFVTTSSFNSYTSSTDSRLTNIESTTASLNSSITNINSFTQSANQRIGSLEAATSSYVTSAITASSLVTASVNLNTITFTKGDASTFNITVNTGSGGGGSTDISSLNAFTASQETKNTTLAGVTSSLNSATASLFNSASLALTTGSIAGNILTFTKGDNQTFSLTIPSATGSVFDTGSFLTTGSLAFGGSTNKGNGVYQFNIATGSAGYAIELFNTGSDALYGGTGSMRFGITDPGNPFIQLKGQAWFQFGTGNQLQFQSFTSSYDNGIIIGPYYTSSQKVHLMPRSSSLQFSQDIGSGEIPIFTLGTHNGVSQSIFEKDLRVKGQFTASLQQGYAWVGNASGISTLVATSSFGGGGGTTFSNPNLQSNSGSLVLIANTFNSGSANLLHLSASTQTQANIVFKNNNNTGTTIISGSNNIFTNPNTPTTGYIKYVGGANNFYLNNTNGINSEITSSAISVSGTRPTMNNNIFQGIAALTINQAVNGGTHTYSNNLFGSANAVTINTLAYTGSSFTVSDNIFKGATVTINPASASLAEIAAGVSGSGGGGIEVLRNMVLGTGTMAISVGPKVTSGFLDPRI